MELTLLKDKIISSFHGSKKELIRILSLVENDNSVFPFNEYELLICSLIECGGLNYSSYIEIRNEYLAKNPYLWVFEISAPRGFGETFAQSLIQEKCSKLLKPNKKLDPNYHGEYDLWFDGIKIEVKASRVVDSESDEPLYRKALSSNTKRPFLMNFQQLKPQCCDVFIWMAVFRDKITFWVMNSKEVQMHRGYSKGQHRGNSGNEGQLHINETNINTLDGYILKGDNLSLSIKRAYSRLK